jgi:hypothetical protein
VSHLTIIGPDCRKLAQDDEYALFSVTLFRRVKDEFAQKAREKKCVVASSLWPLPPCGLLAESS